MGTREAPWVPLCPPSLVQPQNPEAGCAICTENEVTHLEPHSQQCLAGLEHRPAGSEASWAIPHRLLQNESMNVFVE